MAIIMARLREARGDTEGAAQWRAEALKTGEVRVATDKLARELAHPRAESQEDHDATARRALGPVRRQARAIAFRQLKRMLSALVVLGVDWRKLDTRALVMDASRYRRRVMLLDCFFLGLGTCVAAVSVLAARSGTIGRHWPHASGAVVNLSLHLLPVAGVVAAHILVHQALARAMSASAFVSQALDAVATCAEAAGTADAGSRSAAARRLRREVNRLTVQLGRNAPLSRTLPVRKAERPALRRHFKAVACAIATAHRNARHDPGGLAELALLLSTAANQCARKEVRALLPPTLLPSPTPTRKTSWQSISTVVRRRDGIIAGVLGAMAVTPLTLVRDVPVPFYVPALVLGISIPNQALVAFREGFDRPRPFDSLRQIVTGGPHQELATQAATQPPTRKDAP